MRPFFLHRGLLAGRLADPAPTYPPTMKLERLIPPALAWRLNRKKREAAETQLFSDFYQQFLSPGDLCFDIGANLGNRVKSFRKLGCNVIALEPQNSCFATLEKQFATDPGTTLVNKAVGRTTGEAEIHISPDHVLSSLSKDYIQKTHQSGRFAASRWDRTHPCEVTTMDILIEEYGLPRFVKIDVEGYEAEVLAGLSKAVNAFSIEWTPEVPENAITCIHHMASLGDYEFNVSWAETMTFAKRGWRSREAIIALIEEFSGETFLFGDIFGQLRGN